MAYPEQLTERLKIVDTVMTSKALQAGSKATTTIDMSNFRRMVVIAQALSTAATNTVPHATIKILDSTATGTATGTAIVTATIMSQTAGHARPRIIEVRSEQFGKQVASGPLTTRGRYGRVRAVYGTRATQVAIVLLGGDPRHGPQSNTVTTTS
jgi:hypothetical protein